MGNNLVRNSVRFIVLILIQGLIVNNLNLGANVNPFIYILFILMLPTDIPNWLLLFIGFGTGLIMDSFTSTFGLHASACVWIAFCRPIVLKYIAPRDGYEFGSELTLTDQGFNWFVSYTTIIIVLHHLWFFPLELFHFSDYSASIKKIFFSSISSVILIILMQYLMVKPRRKS